MSPKQVWKMAAGRICSEHSSIKHKHMYDFLKDSLATDQELTLFTYLRLATQKNDMETNERQ